MIPENDFARHNRERARNTEAVLDLIASGARHEKNNDLSRAFTDYQEAVRLDPELEKAQTSLRRVKNLIAAEQFQQLMSSGFEALNEKDYNRARSSFLKARSFQPGSPEVKDALVQVDTAIRLARIEALREKGPGLQRAPRSGRRHFPPMRKFSPLIAPSSLLCAVKNAR